MGSDGERSVERKSDYTETNTEDSLQTPSKDYSSFDGSKTGGDSKTRDTINLLDDDDQSHSAPSKDQTLTPSQAREFSTILTKKKGVTPSEATATSSETTGEQKNEQTKKQQKTQTKKNRINFFGLKCVVL